MKTDFSFLPDYKQRELKGIVTVLIPRFAEIEMIILFGRHARNTWVEDYYTEKGNQYSYISDYDLLIMLSKTPMPIAIPSRRPSASACAICSCGCQRSPFASASSL